MAFIITKLYTMHMVVYVQILLKLPVVFTKTGKNKIQFVGVRFGFWHNVKALIGGNAF